MLRTMSDTSGAILPVITILTDASGVRIGDAQELRIMSSLVATRVTNDGPTRIELSTYVDPSDLRPFSVPVRGDAVAAGTATDIIIAFADPNASSRFGSVALWSDSALTANNTNYAAFVFFEATEAGTPVGSPLATVTTQASGAGATGSWSAGSIAFDAGLGVDIGAGNSLRVTINSTHGAGVNVPAFWLRIT